jgi:methyltransferase FkbM-like protein
LVAARCTGQKFGTASVRLNRVAVFDNINTKHHSILKRLDVALVGRNAALSDIYGFSADDLAQCEVPSRRLYSLLSWPYAPATFDILSVDVEGLEIEALMTNDFTAHRPRAIVVEYRTMGKINLGLQR